ncbi:hypothetical protein E4U58_003724 [Claviceps cyperi]|nr:hypothetical protein E4U58_003724 [Claviceps cyperi]
MDQFASIGVEFDLPSLKRIIEHTDDFYEFADAQSGAKKEKMTNRRRKHVQWASDAIYERNRPFRPWSLGAIQKASGLLFSISGHTARTPGMYRQVDPKTSQSRDKFLQNTNERVRSSVRVRLACQGLGLNDRETWTCAALADWKLKRAIFEMDDEEWYNDERPYGRDSRAATSRRLDLAICWSGAECTQAESHDGRAFGSVRALFARADGCEESK